MSRLNDLHGDAALVDALGAMAAVVGAANIQADDATRERYARSTAARPVRPLPWCARPTRPKWRNL
jgi:hypothetical protein